MSESFDAENKLVIAETTDYQGEKNEPSTSGMSGDRPTKRVGRRPGRRSSKMDVRAKLERSRQSARECRARKKLRYQYLEDLVANREKAVFALREELELYKQWCIQVDEGLLPMGLLKLAREQENAEKKSQVKISAGGEGGKRDIARGGGSKMSTKDVKEHSDIIETVSSRNHSYSKTEKPQMNTVFKAPKPITSTVNSVRKYGSDFETGASGFLSDLSSYSTVDVDELGASENLDLITIDEEDAVEKSSQLKNDVSLLPTFIEDLNDE